MKIKSVLCMPNLCSVSLHFAFFWCLGPSNSGCVNCSLKSSFSTNLCSPWYFIQHLYLFLGSCLVWYKAFHHDEKWKAFLLLLSVIEFKVIIYIWKSKSHYFNVIIFSIVRESLFLEHFCVSGLCMDVFYLSYKGCTYSVFFSTLQI